MLVGSLLVSLAAMPAQAARPKDLLPDLQMAPLFGVALSVSNGAMQLSFGTLVNNIGDGPIVVSGHYPRNYEMRHVVQLITQTDGTVRPVRQPQALMYFEPVGVHDHWHLRDFITMRLTSLAANAPPDRRSAKIGFCFYDTTRLPPAQRPAASTPKRYTSCGTEASKRVRMGISVGWGDAYLPAYEFQDIDVTGLPAGGYRLCATVNPQDIWLEATFANNSYWLDLQIRPGRGKVTILDQGNTPC